jgi:hypothetical protein
MDEEEVDQSDCDKLAESSPVKQTKAAKLAALVISIASQAAQTDDERIWK